MHNNLFHKTTSNKSGGVEEYGRNIIKTLDVQERVEQQLRERLQQMQKANEAATRAHKSKKGLKVTLPYPDATVDSTASQLFQEKESLYTQSIKTLNQQIQSASTDNLDSITRSQQNIVNVVEELKELQYLYSKYIGPKLQQYSAQLRPQQQSSAIRGLLAKAEASVAQIEQSLKYEVQLKQMAQQLSEIRKELQHLRRTRIQKVSTLTTTTTPTKEGSPELGEAIIDAPSLLMYTPELSITAALEKYISERVEQIWTLYPDSAKQRQSLLRDTHKILLQLEFLYSPAHCTKFEGPDARLMEAKFKRLEDLYGASDQLLLSLLKRLRELKQRHQAIDTASCKRIQKFLEGRMQDFFQESGVNDGEVSTSRTSISQSEPGHDSQNNNPISGAYEKQQQWRIGPRGGRYYLNSSGRKIYNARYNKIQ